MNYFNWSTPHLLEKFGVTVSISVTGDSDLLSSILLNFTPSYTQDSFFNWQVGLDQVIYKLHDILAHFHIFVTYYVEVDGFDLDRTRVDLAAVYSLISISNRTDMKIPVLRVGPFNT